MVDHADAVITMVIADDHEIVRRGLTTFIDAADNFEIIGTASNGIEAVDEVAAKAPDILLLDLLMPGQSAEETVRRAKAASPRTQIVVLTSHEGEEHVGAVLRAGALSYVLKDIAPKDLLIVIRDASRGSATISQRVAKGLLEQNQGEAGDDLTAREHEVLRAIASGQSNRQIGEELGIAERTVKCHVSNILSKLYLADRTQAAVYAWKKGMVG
ncbi:MAG: response regulator transcription factor [Pseudomonadota bacterium]